MTLFRQPLFDTLSGAEMAVARATAHMAQEGHNAAVEIARRRLDGGLHNFRHCPKHAT